MVNVSTESLIKILAKDLTKIFLVVDGQLDQQADLFFGSGSEPGSEPGSGQNSDLDRVNENAADRPKLALSQRQLQAQRQMIEAMQQAIAAHDPFKTPEMADVSVGAIEVCTPEQLRQIIGQSRTNQDETDQDKKNLDGKLDTIAAAPYLICPLTLNLPDLPPLPEQCFPNQAIYQHCQNLEQLRHQAQQLHLSIGQGHFWLPIVWTSKGPLYGEVISRRQFFTTSLHESKEAGLEETDWQQPIHLSDRWRQPLYRVGQRLLKELAAPPAVYLLQFGWQADQICFDRLLPFPAVPALASVGVQVPDLFVCHWRCLTNQPILDVAIGSTAPFLTFSPQ